MEKPDGSVLLTIPEKIEKRVREIPNRATLLRFKLAEAFAGDILINPESVVAVVEIDECGSTMHRDDLHLARRARIITTCGEFVVVDPVRAVLPTFQAATARVGTYSERADADQA